MKPKDGRKALVVFSDGVDRGSKETLNDAVDAADRAGVAVYTIYFKGEQERSQNGFPGMGAAAAAAWRHGWRRLSRRRRWLSRRGGGYPGRWRRGGGGQSEPGVDGKKIMEKIATRTGGRYFEAKKKDNLEEIYGQIAEELRGQYLLTYTPGRGGQGRRLPQDRAQGQQGRPDRGHARRLLRAGRGPRLWSLFILLLSANGR
jgi:VWFA-related protein